MPIWAVVVPASAQWLQQRVGALRKTVLGPHADVDDQEDLGWQVIEGSGSHSALWDFTPGSEGLDMEVARALSRESEGPVYLLNLGEHLRGSATYEQGAHAEDLPDDPEELAERFGVPFPRKVSSRRPPMLSVSVVEGVDPDSVASALGMRRHTGAPVRFDPVPLGTLISTVDHDGGGFAIDIGEPFPTAVAYEVMHDPSDGAFSVTMYRGGCRAGHFELSPSDANPTVYGTPMRDVKGKTTFREIIQALGIPYGILGIKR